MRLHENEVSTGGEDIGSDLLTDNDNGALVAIEKRIALPSCERAVEIDPVAAGPMCMWRYL